MKFPFYLTCNDRKYVSYSSFDGDVFYIPLSDYGRDYMERPDHALNLTDLRQYITSAQTCTGEELTEEELQYALEG